MAKPAKYNAQQKVIMDDMHRLCAHYRGLIVHQFVQIENGIELIISDFFCGVSDASSNLLGLISSKDEILGFHAKMAMLSYILNSHFDAFLKNNSEYLKDLEYLLQIRNKAAHRRQNINEVLISEFDKSSIVLTWSTARKGKLKMEHMVIDKEFMKDYGAKCKRVHSTTLALHDLVTKGSD